MNTKNETLAVVDGRVGKKLESLPEEKRQLILELAAHTRLFELVVILKEHGIETSESSLSRFLRAHRAQKVLEDGEEMKGTVEALARRGQGESFRKGSIETLRQRMYDQAMMTVDPQEARELYREFLKEEAKLKELELEGRKAAALEEQVKLQRLRIEIQAENCHKRTTKRGILIETGPAGEEKGRAVAELPGPSGEKSLTEGNEEGKGREARLAEVWERLGEILNRGARAEEKVLEARAVWEEGGRLLAGPAPAKLSSNQ